MISQQCLPHRSEMEEKATRKFPFTLNNETYFSSECFFQNTIVNGISLQVKQAKGISNQLEAISYLGYSNRLIFYVGCQILSYNTYKRKYQMISHCNNLICLKAFSLSTAEKEYIAWVEILDKEEGGSHTYLLCIYDMNSKQKIYSQKFFKIARDLKSTNVEIIVFMHPIKVVGLTFYDVNQNESRVIFKKMNKVHEQTDFGDEFLMTFPYQLRKIKYDLQSNSYFFIRNQYEIWSLQCLIEPGIDDILDLRNQNNSRVLSTEKLLCIKDKNLLERKIIDYDISQAYLLLLVSKPNNNRDLEFYSLFSYGFIFSENVWTIEGNELGPTNKINTENQSMKPRAPIDSIEFNKTIIICFRENSTEISIYSLCEQNLRHIRDSFLDIGNCYKIEKLFINPFSSEVLVLSRHYELEGTISTTLKSTKIISKPEMKYKNFFLDISSFFITMEAAVIEVQRMFLQKKNYVCILTAPWLSQFIIQAQNSVKTKRSQQKFDANIKCSAIHPTGQYVALGFADCFKIYFLTFEGLIHTFMSENTKECISLSYSKQGNDFAVATSINILIYDCYSYEKKQQICLGISYRIEEINYVEGFQNNKVKQCLQCVTNTKRLVCYNAGLNYIQQFSFNPKSHLENGIFEGIMSLIQSKAIKPNQEANSRDYFGSCFLNGESNKNSSQNVSKKTVSAIAYDEQTGVVIFSFGTKLYFISSKNFECLGCFQFQQISCMELCRNLKTLFLGTFTGKIFAYPWPNKPINITSKIPTFLTHRGRIKKIKVTSNLFELISITDQSMFIHSITLVHEMRKIQKYQLQREYCPKSLASIDLMPRTGICLFTGQKFQEKCQIIKENQQEAVNVVFMLPEQREKQKLNMLNKLETQREKKALKIQEEGVPLKIDAINIKEKTKNLQKSFKNFISNYEAEKERELESYQQKISELNKVKDELRIKHSQISRKLEKEFSSFKEEQRIEQIKAEAVYRMKTEQALRQVNEADFQRSKNANNFYELNEMDQERKMLSQSIIKHIQTEISDLLQRNGYLSCRNTNLEKDICTKRRKIEDIKQLIHSTERAIKNLPKKSRACMKPEDIKQQSQINQQFADTERRYLKETKKLIEKNKAINVSIELYEKERELLIILENELEKSEKSIEQILQYIMKEKQEKKAIQNKLELLNQKVKKIMEHYQNRNSMRIKVKNTLKQYLFQLTLYQQGVIDIQKLKVLSSIKASDMFRPPENIQISIEEKKKKIGKIESSEEKIMNLMKNERKIYSNESKKTCVHNQDLLVNYNFLLHENKHLVNLMKDQQEKKKYCIKNITSKRDYQKSNSRPTPFSSYIQLKSNRRLKTSPCAEYDLSG